MPWLPSLHEIPGPAASCGYPYLSRTIKQKKSLGTFTLRQKRSSWLPSLPGWFPLAHFPAPPGKLFQVSKSCFKLLSPSFTGKLVLYWLRNPPTFLICSTHFLFWRISRRSVGIPLGIPLTQSRVTQLSLAARTGTLLRDWSLYDYHPNMFYYVLWMPHKHAGWIP